MDTEAFDEVPVQLPPKTRGVAEYEVAVVEGWSIVDHPPPDRVTVGMEALDERAVGLTRDQMGWRPEAPRGGPSVRRRSHAMAAVLRHAVGPPDQDASKLHTSTAPASIRSRQPLGLSSLCPAQTGIAAREAHVAQSAPVVVPPDGLLEPADPDTRPAGSPVRRLARTVQPWFASI